MSWAKHKSWSVILVDGHILNGEVRADHCRNCDSKTKIISGNNGDPDLFLYGCSGHKCKNVLIRMKFIEADQIVPVSLPVAVTSVAVFQEIHA